MTLLSLIAAMDRNRLIGGNNQLLWKLPADMAHFRQLTLGKPVIMGRSTFASIGRALKGRQNIVLTRDPAFQAEGCTVVHSIDEALAAAQPAAEVMVMGGANIYAQFMPQADRLYITLVEGRAFEGDAWFPRIDEKTWQVIQRDDHPADANNPHPYSFVIYQRRV